MLPLAALCLHLLCNAVAGGEDGGRRLLTDLQTSSRRECTEEVDCDAGTGSIFLPHVEVKCFRDPLMISQGLCVKVHVKTMVDYNIVDSDQYVYIVLQDENSYIEGEVLYEQYESTFNVDEPTGIAIDGVLIYSGTLRDGEDALYAVEGSDDAERIDRCGGTLSATADNLYHYRAMPACVLGSTWEDTEDLRKTYVSDVHELLDSFEAYKGPRLIGVGLDGYPIYSPYTDRGLLQAGLDNCNGKVTNNSYAYYVTPWFPYTIGCFGPGVYSLDETEDGLGSTARGASSACPGGSQYSLRTNGCVLCPAGTYSVASYTRESACTGICPVGHYCPKGSQSPIPCPRGRFGSSVGETDIGCSGPCAGGYWCAEASWRPDANPCGNSSYYCPKGSGFPENVLPSYYSIPEGALLRTGENICEPGYYCQDGSRYPCPAGVYGNTPGLLTKNCTAPCPEGYYCPEGSEIPAPCPAGQYGDSLGLSEPTCSGPCEPGYWCPLASQSPRARNCPGGRYGPMAGLKTSQCSENCEPAEILSDLGVDSLPAQLHVGSSYFSSVGLSEGVLPNPRCVSHLCAEGYYCPETSTSATQAVCGSPAVYCPIGSETPTPVSLGHYTIGKLSRQGEMQSAEDGSTRFWQAPCENGFSCVGGVKMRCPAGRFGAHPVEADFSCTGLCDPGFYCKEASSSRNQNPCGNVSVYCPEGSSSPHVVPPAYYSVNGTDSTRSAIVHCPPGHYCTAGIKRPCVPGRYSTDGSATSECDGLCTAGYYCPEASTSPTQVSCPAGRYGQKGMTDANCLGICTRGYFCPSNSTRSMQKECGGEYVYCPVGSGEPSEVDVGYYSSGGTVTTRFMQLQCVKDSSVLGTPPAAAERINICPSTTRWE